MPGEGYFALVGMAWLFTAALASALARLLRLDEDRWFKGTLLVTLPLFLLLVLFRILV